MTQIANSHWDGQGRDNMMQDSQATHNHYLRTLVFYLYKVIAKS